LALQLLLYKYLGSPGIFGHCEHCEAIFQVHNQLLGDCFVNIVPRNEEKPANHAKPVRQSHTPGVDSLFTILR
jgi:hypothetical protein